MQNATSVSSLFASSRQLGVELSEIRTVLAQNMTMETSPSAVTWPHFGSFNLPKGN